MGTGYTRNDTSNNIADGNVINASDLDGEFDALQSAFDASSGHSHDGTTGEGPQIAAAGIANNAVALGTKTTGNYVATGAVSGVGLSGSASAEGATFTVTSNATNANTANTIVSRDASGNFSAGTITAALTGDVTGNVSGTSGSTTGNAATATALATGRTIGMTGDVVWTSASFDGSGNVTGTATIQANSVALGTDTTGAYVADISAGNAITVSGGGSETATVTVNHADTSSQASSNNSGRTYIQDITLDTYGHVTGIATATETVTDTDTTYTAGGDYGMTLSGTEFRLEDDRRRNSTSTDIYSGNTHDFTFYDANVGIRWYTAGAEEMRLTDAGDLEVDGNVTAYSTVVSDPRLKENIQPVTDALSKVEKLGGYTFNYKHNGLASAGVMSTEVKDVLPSAIRQSTLNLMLGDDNQIEYDTVQYDQLHALLIEAVKELSARVKELEEARQVQIRLNDQFRQGLGKITEKLITPEEKQTLWERIKGIL